LVAAVDELDDAPGVMDCIVLVAAILDPQQDAVADAGNLVRPRAAWNPDADLGGGAVLGLIPFGRDRDQFAVAVARRDVGDHDMGQGSGMVQLLAALLDAALVRKLAQHRLEGGAVGVLQVEGARDLARADLSGLAGDEGEDLVPGGQGFTPPGPAQAGVYDLVVVITLSNRDCDDPGRTVQDMVGWAVIPVLVFFDEKAPFCLEPG
jgi:hypothetical protein